MKKAGLLKELRTTSLDYAVGCAFLIYFEVQPRWVHVVSFVALYFVFLILEAVVETTLERRREQ